MVSCRLPPSVMISARIVCFGRFGGFVGAALLFSDDDIIIVGRMICACVQL